MAELKKSINTSITNCLTCDLTLVRKRWEVLYHTFASAKRYL